MKIKINETGKIEELTITDPKTGVDYIQDLMGNHDALPEMDVDEEFYLMDRDDFEWWLELTTDLEAAEIRKATILANLPEEKAEEMEGAVQFMCNCDLEGVPGFINIVCDEYEARSEKMKIKFIEKDQIWQNETTNYWFDVNGECFAISDCNSELSLLDEDSFPIENCNDHDGIKDLLIPLYENEVLA